MKVRDDDWEPRLQDEEVQRYILDEVGPEGAEMARYLQQHPGVSGVDIVEAQKEKKASDVRKVLYKMMEAHCAEYEKDTDSKGWETFLWHLDLNEIKYILRRRWADELLHLRKQIKFYDDHQFFACPTRPQPIEFEEAMEMNFICPHCQKPLVGKNIEGLKADLKTRVEELAPHFQA